jgi:hypothetical protein
MDRGVALAKTLAISYFPSSFVTRFEPRLIHSRKLARHDAMIFSMGLRNRWRERQRDVGFFTTLHKASPTAKPALYPKEKAPR